MSLKKIEGLLETKVAARWYQMGIVMGVPLAELEMIRMDTHYQSVVDRETAMIRSWLKSGLLPRTWQVLVDAVENPAGGRNRLLARGVASRLKNSQ